MFYEFGTILSSVALSKLDCHLHNLHVKYVCVKTNYSRATWGYASLPASDSHRRCFDVRNKIIYCISTILAYINIMKRRHAALIFKKESHKSKLKSANTKIYL